MRALTIRVPDELYNLFVRAERLDIRSRSMSHFATMAMEDRAHQIMEEQKEEEGCRE